MPVQGSVKFDHDLKTTPLYIKTDSADGSFDLVMVEFYDRNVHNQIAGGVTIIFRDPPVYSLTTCTSSPRSFPTAPPSNIDKVWRISVERSSDYRIIIRCNDVEVLNVLINHSTCSPYNNDITWTTYWNLNVDKIEFGGSDTASDYYCSYLPVTPGNYR